LCIHKEAIKKEETHSDKPNGLLIISLN
jgi:hypothetical protein